MKKLVIVLVAVCGLAAVGTASAEELGDRNSVAITGTASAQLATAPGGWSSAVTTISPRVAWFFADGVSLSIGPRYSHIRFAADETHEQTVDRFGGDLRIGGLVDLSEHVSLWPQAGFYLDTAKSTLSGVGWIGGSVTGPATPYSVSNDGVIYGASAEVPVVLKLSKHTFATLSFVTANYETAKPAEAPATHTASFTVNPGFGFGIGGWL
jgi:hypothetical protein